MSFLTPLYVLGLSAVDRSARVSPDPPVAARRGAVQLADVSGADSAAADPAQPAGPSSALAPAAAPALCLLAFAFARPFLREAARLGFGESSGGGSPCLIDTSASMRRGDLWPRAVEQAEQGDRRLPAGRPTGGLLVRRARPSRS